MWSNNQHAPMFNRIAFRPDAVAIHHIAWSVNSVWVSHRSVAGCWPCCGRPARANISDRPAVYILVLFCLAADLLAVRLFGMVRLICCEHYWNIFLQYCLLLLLSLHSSKMLNCQCYTQCYISVDPSQNRAISLCMQTWTNQLGYDLPNIQQCSYLLY